MSATKTQKGHEDEIDQMSAMLDEKDDEIDRLNTEIFELERQIGPSIAFQNLAEKKYENLRKTILERIRQISYSSMSDVHKHACEDVYRFIENATSINEIPDNLQVITGMNGQLEIHSY